MRRRSALIRALFLLSVHAALHLAATDPPSAATQPPSAASPATYAMRHWDTDEGLPSHTISDIQQGPDGYLWMASTAGLIRFDGDRFTVFDQRTAGLPNPRVQSIYFTRAGGVRIIADDDTVMESPTIAAPQFSPYARPPDKWDDTLDRHRESRGTPSVVPRPGWTARLVDRFGNQWFSSVDAVEVWRPEGAKPFWRHTFTEGTTINAFTEDTEGDIWIGTVTDGLYRIKPVAFRVFGEEMGIQDRGMSDVWPGDDGSVLLRSALSRLYVLRNDIVTPIGADFVESTYRDLRGTTWTLRMRVTGSLEEVVLQEGPGPGAGRIVRFPPIVGLVHLFESAGAPGILWARDATRVYRIDLSGSGTPRVETIDGSGDLRQAHVDRAGTLWSVSSAGITRIRGNERTRYTVTDGLPTNRVRSIYEDANGTLWFGTYGAGIVRLKDGRFQSLDESRGLADGVVNTILEDRAGNFWMSGNHGIHRAPRKDLEAVFDGRAARVDAVLYGRPAGLVNPESNGTPGEADSAGRFWFTTFYGVVLVDPAEALALEATPIRVAVGSLTSVPRAATRDERGVYSVPPGQQSVEIAYAAIALRDPENVRFQYYLEGYDPEWIEAGTRRTSTYTRLPPASYRFHVRAFTAPGRWIEAESAQSIVVVPAFYQTGWFQALIAAAVIAVALAAYRLRTGVLRRRAARLETTVAERTRELAREKETVARQVEQLQELERAKSRFFANVSHEFRTPLTLIQGPLEDLQQGLHGPLSEDVRDQVNVATRSSHRLLGLVDQLLDIARAESGRLGLRARRGDFRLFLRRVVGGLSPLAERRGIDLVLETPEAALPLWFDPEHLEKVLLNVIGNGLKFTPNGGHVRVAVHLEAGAPESGWLVAAISDDGPGISDADLPRIFDRFHRGGGKARSQPGAGIGLALARELVSLHGGTIQAESREGQGSIFTIRLPLGRAHLADDEIAPEDESDLLRPVGGTGPLRAAPAAGSGEEAGGEAAPAASGGRPPEEPIGIFAEVTGGAARTEIPAGVGETDTTTVLVADDNDEVRSYVRGHLQQRYRVLEASNGREALEVVRRGLPDLVVSDVMMPVMDGIALCRAIKSDPEIDFIPVVLLTARASTDSRIEGLEEGADDYLTKPFNVRELEARIRNLIASRRRLQSQLSGSMQPHSFSIPPGVVSVESADAAFLDQVRASIESHLGDEDFDVDVLAREVGASRATLYRRLKEHLSQSPMDLIRRARLEQAAALLRRREGSIGEIAYAVGFRSVAHFSTSFKEEYGTTPTAYRREQAGKEPPRD